MNQVRIDDQVDNFLRLNNLWKVETAVPSFRNNYRTSKTNPPYRQNPPTLQKIL